MDVTVVSGVPGVGASAVCTRARDRIERHERGDDYELVNFGDVLLERAVTRGLVEDRDDLATLPRGELRRLQRRAGEYVARRAQSRSVLLNTHLSVDTVHGYLPGLPQPVLGDLAPDRFVLVEADPESVLERRAEVDYREHTWEGRRAVEFHQDLNRAAAMSYATAVDAPVRLVDNTDDLDRAVERLARIVTEADPDPA